MSFAANSVDLETDGEAIHMIGDLRSGTKYMLCLTALGKFRNSTEVIHTVVTNIGELQETRLPDNLLWASYQIRGIAGCACAANAWKVFPCHQFQRKPSVSDPGMHHGTRVTHVPWFMSGSLTRGGRKNVPGIPGACATPPVKRWSLYHSNHK